VAAAPAQTPQQQLKEQLIGAWKIGEIYYA
jgi:hypothetical protein